MKKPELHFISTGAPFPYPFYLAVTSALKTQDVSAVNIWLTTPAEGRFFDLIKDKVNVIEVEVPAFRALENESGRVKSAHIKDYLAWKVLYERGGLYMDLDVLCMKDATDLLDGKKVLVFPDNSQRSFVNVSVMGAQPKTDFMKSLLNDTLDKLNNQDSIEWTEIGAVLLMEHMKKNPDDVVVGDYGLAGHCIGSGLNGMFTEGDSLYNPDARVAHLYGIANKLHFNEVDENYIENRDTVYARLVRQVLTEEEWDTRWSLVEDIGGKEKFFFEPNVNGYPMFLLKNEPYLSVSCRYNHVWEKITTDFVKSNLKEGQTFIDVGACIGYYTVLASKLVGDSGHVVAFEPCSLVLPLLKANLILNNCTNVRLIEKAATAGKGTAKIFSWGKDANYIQYSLTKESEVFEEVETTSVDEEISLSEPPQMIKIDVDGGEPSVIDGMDKLLREDIPIYIIMEDFDKKTVDRLSSDYGVALVGEEKPADNYLMYKPVRLGAVPYKIRSSFLSAPWFEKLLFETLDMYLRGEDLSNSPITKTGRKLAWKNEWHWTTFDPENPEKLEEGLRNREKELIKLYHSIKDNGYDGSMVAAWFDLDGGIHLYDGFHRIAIMRYLGMDPVINVDTIWWSKDYDFPLRAVLTKLRRVGKWTYQPVDDDRVRDFPIDRPDSPARLEYMLKNLVGETVLDIGCSEGYFSRELAKRGYKVTAIDADQGKIAVTRYLSTINNLEVECHQGEGEEFLRKSDGFDNVLYLSVFHNNVTTYGTAKAFMELRKLKGKVKRLFFEVPDAPREQPWAVPAAGQPLYHFKGSDFEKTITEALGMRIQEVYKGNRPIYLLVEDSKKSKTPLFRKLSDKEWEKHSRWEKGWWNNATDTFGEQALQDSLYLKPMKLDQYFTRVRRSLEMRGKSVIDIGGGPVSLLLRCVDISRAVVVDPCDFPKWVGDRYKMAKIEYVKEQAENITYDKEFDEAWIYNVLQHVRDPEKVIKNAIASARLVRVIEPLEIGVHPGHPHNLYVEALDKAFGREGLVYSFGGKPGEVYYHGVFIYE